MGYVSVNETHEFQHMVRLERMLISIGIIAARGALAVVLKCSPVLSMQLINLDEKPIRDNEDENAKCQSQQNGNARPENQQRNFLKMRFRHQCC